ncbi:MAG: outer membrane beta-barrel protein [Bacteroides sp.]|nr:outer membrane beta-barrel protein [Bacteroides sp.]
MKQLLFFLAFIAMGATAMAQDATDKHLNSNELEFNIDFHHTWGLVEKGDGYKNQNDLYGNSARISVLYRFTPRLKAGVGIGLEMYSLPNTNTKPVFLAVQYAPLKKDLKPYLFTNIGYGLDGDDFNEGWLAEVGVGYKYMFKRHFGLKAEVGYNYKSFNYGDWQLNRHSISAGFGLVF